MLSDAGDPQPVRLVDGKLPVDQVRAGGSAAGSRTVSLLTLPWDDDVRKLWGSATAHPDKCDTELSRSEQQAYDRVVRRIDDLWTFRPGVDQPRS